MSVKCSSIMSYMEGLAPRSLAEDWDNVGLLLGNKDRDVGRILTCLDVTPAVVQEAEAGKVDLIISHHPFIFSGLKRIREDEVPGGLIYRLIRADIAVFSAHTNLDFAKGGLNETLALRVGLSDIKGLEKRGAEIPYGNVGLLGESVTLPQFVEKVKTQLGLDHVRVIGEVESVRRVGVFCGSFDKGIIDSLIGEKVDVLLTGDVKHHDALALLEGGICTIDAGHYGTESLIGDRLVELLSSEFPDIQILRSEMEKPPVNIH